MIDSEDCESKGMRMVTTKKECEDAAVFLKLTDTSADELLQNEDLAPGCIYQNNRWLAWASLKNHPDTSKPCGTSQWVVLHKLLIASSCICASRSGKPYNSTALKQLNHRLNAINTSVSRTKILSHISFAATCTDGQQNQGEADIDCGGPCTACPTCNDGIQNQGEMDHDCGGPCTPCPTCNDGIKNGREINIDCGGPCPACPTCVDGIQNQGETAVDCGGPCATHCHGMKNMLQ